MDSSNIIITISIVIAVLAFVALVIFLICTLVCVMRSLRRTERLIEHSNGIAANVEQKLRAFDPLFDQIQEFGEMIDHKRESIKREEEKIIAKEQGGRHESIAGIVDLCELALVGISVVSKFFKKRR